MLVIRLISHSSSIFLGTKRSLILSRMILQVICANRSLIASTTPIWLKVLYVLFKARCLRLARVTRAHSSCVGSLYKQVFSRGVIKLSTVYLTSHRIFAFNFNVPSILLIFRISSAYSHIIVDIKTVNRAHSKRNTTNCKSRCTSEIFCNPWSICNVRTLLSGRRIHMLWASEKNLKLIYRWIADWKIVLRSRKN